MADIFETNYKKYFGGSGGGSDFNWSDIPSRALDYRTKQLVLERLQKYGDREAESDLNYKDALTQDLIERANKARYDIKVGYEDKYADKRAKELARQALEKARSGRAILEGLLSLPEGPTPEQVRPVVPNLPESVRSILEPSPDVSNYTNDAIKTAVRMLREQDPEASKTLREETKGQFGLDREDLRQTMTNERKQWELELKEKQMKQQEELKNRTKTVQEQYTRDRDAYLKNPNDETYRRVEESRKYLDRLTTLATLSRIQNNPSLEALGIETLGSPHDTPTERIHGNPQQPPKQESTGKDGWTVRNGVKFRKKQ